MLLKTEGEYRIGSPHQQACGQALREPSLYNPVMSLARRNATVRQAPPVQTGDAALELEVRRIGTDLIEAARSSKTSIFSKKFWSDQLLDWSMREPAFKVQL